MRSSWPRLSASMDESDVAGTAESVLTGAAGVVASVGDPCCIGAVGTGAEPVSYTHL